MSYCSLQEEKGKTVRKVRLRIENTWKIKALKDAPKDIIWKGYLEALGAKRPSPTQEDF